MSSPVKSEKTTFRRNTFASFGEAIFWESANGMTPQNTVIMSLLRNVTPFKTVLSLVGVINNVIQNVPQIFAARRMEKVTEYKPLLLLYAMCQRFSWFLLAALVFWLLPLDKTLFLVLFFACYGIFGYFAGQTSLVWINFMAKLIPNNSLGRFLGFRAAVGSTAAIAGAFFSRWELERFDFPGNFALLFVVAAVLGGASIAVLSSSVEPKIENAKPKRHEKGFLQRAVLICKTDRNFQGYFLSTVFIVLGKMAFPFQVVYAQEKLGIGVGQVAFASAALMIGQTLGYLFWGWLVDRHSFKFTINLSAFSFVPSLVLTYFMANEWMLYGAVGLFAFSQSARNFGENGLVMEICKEDERPIYIGLRNTILGPFFAVSNFAGGLLTDLCGYQTVVLIAIPLVIAGGVINWTMIRTCRVEA